MRSLPGIVNVDASYRQSEAVAEYDPEKVSPEQIAQAINGRTYYRAAVLSVGEGPFAPLNGTGARPERTASATILVEGMTDDLSASQVLAAMGSPGITDVTVDTSRSQLTIEFDSSRVNASWFVNIINNTTPFRASLVEVTEPSGDGGGLNAVWFAAGAAGAVGVGFLLWYSLRQPRRRAAVARAQRRRETRRRSRRR